MSRPEAGAEFDAGYWEDRYRAASPPVRHSPSPALAVEAAALVPGRALDAGCGLGADAIWLANRGWRVHALDIAATALTSAREAARSAGRDVEERIAWLHADVTAWDPGEQRFDLVSAQYVHVPGPVAELVRRLASWVVPGGTLLVAGHDGAHDGGEDTEDDGAGDDAAHGGGAAATHPPSARLQIEQVTAVLGAGEWHVDVAERRTSVVRRPDGAGAAVLHDVVVRAHRV